MLNTLLISTWGILVTLGIFYFQQTRAQDTGVENAPVVVFENYKTDTVSTALFSAGNIAGHFVTTIQFQLPEKVHKNLKLPVDFIIEDQLFGIVNALNINEMKKFKNAELQEIAHNLEAALHSDEFPIKNVKFEGTEILSK